MAQTTAKTWLSGSDSRRLLGGMGWTEFLKCALVHKVRVQALPGIPLKFHAEDVAKLAEAIGVE